MKTLQEALKQNETMKQALEAIAEGCGPPDCIAQRALDEIKEGEG